MMAEQEKVPFCDNPLCQLHGVKVLPHSEFIQRELPVKAPETEPRIERHVRYPYQVDDDHLRHFCEVCANSIEMCRPQHREQKVIAPERKLILLS